ncbi:HAD-IC family P-type ATPase [Nonomuraea sp. SYSU D8015]|uniref:HAD-IC family P-type ATPase n=1 Tax=Nonomuraea sp. SYSU D8015 TaxID=2593644 RepID=UPI0022DD1E59|nr:HAD-IC family P-type ATPase [Nonomuraea sp. SYSU D8015]
MGRLPASRMEAAGFDPGLLTGTLVLTGLHAMHDPPRPVAAIGRQAGLLPFGGEHDGKVFTGADLATLPDEKYPEAVERATVLARVSPEQKLRLVEALQARDHVVAMTRDGVNDAPALRRADIGIAMGRGGTQVAKDAADMALPGCSSPGTLGPGRICIWLLTSATPSVSQASSLAARLGARLVPERSPVGSLILKGPQARTKDEDRRRALQGLGCKERLGTWGLVLLPAAVHVRAGGVAADLRLRLFQAIPRPEWPAEWRRTAPATPRS